MAQVTLFGAYQDMAGWRTRAIAGGSLGAVRRAVAAADTELGRQLGLPCTLVILNETLVGRGDAADALPVADNDDIAFGPPVSGG